MHEIEKVSGSVHFCVRATDYGIVQQAAMGGLLRRPAVFGGAHKMYKHFFLHLHKIVMQNFQGLIKCICIFVYTFIKL